MGKGWGPFKTEDTFNPGVIVEGMINRSPTFYYGSLYILTVNGVPCKQFIPCTPKMHYPYNMEGKFNWPKDIKSLDVYDKIDGTNIFQFTYHDAEGKEYISYKTRLTPFINPGSKYEIFGLWNDMLAKYPGIKDYPGIMKKLLGKSVGISYEMYGRKNLILVRYKELLDCKVIFMRELDGVWAGGSRRILPPSQERHLDTPVACDIITNISPDSNLEEEYWKIKEWLDTKLTIKCAKCEKEKIKVLAYDDNGFEKEILVCKKCTLCNNGANISDLELTADIVEGLEGCIIYANSEYGTLQYKVKPQYVLDIHMKSANTIPLHAILITIKNAFEETENVTIEQIVSMLEEEFSIENISRKMNTISKVLSGVKADRVIRSKILPIYDEMKSVDSDFDINLNKGKVMRYFATRLDEFGLTKKESTKLFTLLWGNYGVEEGL